MKKIFLTILTAISLITNTLSYADLTATYTQGSTPQNTTAISFQQTNWVSKNMNDNVVIHNGSGGSLVIEISVNRAAPNAAGVIIKNCGTTTNIKAGEAAICSNSDVSNPVSFSSDSDTYPATGIYQIQQK